MASRKKQCTSQLVRPTLNCPVASSGSTDTPIEHCAFLVRFHVGLNVDPLAISVPIIDLPLVSPDDCRDIVMGHKICLVVHSDMPPCSAPVSQPKPMSLGSRKPTEPSPSATAKSANTAAPAVNAGKVKVLIEPGAPWAIESV